MPGLPRSARLRRERGFLRFLTKDGSSALHRIREYQAVCRVCLRPIEASDNFWQRVFDIPAVAPPLELQVHVLKAGPRALARCADCPDPLAALDTVSGPNRNHGGVAIDRSVAVGIMVDDDDQAAQIAVVPRHGDAAVGRREHVGPYTACDVDAAMRTRARWPSEPSQSPKAARIRGGPSAGAVMARPRG